MNVVEIMIVMLKLRVVIWLDLTLVRVMKAIRVLAPSVPVSFSKRKIKSNREVLQALCWL